MRKEREIAFRLEKIDMQNGHFLLVSLIDNFLSVCFHFFFFSPPTFHKTEDGTEKLQPGGREWNNYLTLLPHHSHRFLILRISRKFSTNFKILNLWTQLWKIFQQILRKHFFTSFFQLWKILAILSVFVSKFGIYQLFNISWFLLKFYHFFFKLFFKKFSKSWISKYRWVINFFPRGIQSEML